jgi:hypothetical protein
MVLRLDAVREEDRGVISPCGIVCLGCDIHRDESLEAAKTVVKIWEGFNLPDVASAFGLDPKDVVSTLNTLKKYIKLKEEAGPCPGCFKGGWPSEMCGIVQCVQSKGYWTCAECGDYDPDSKKPCPHFDADAPPLGSRGGMSEFVCRRYDASNTENLKRCREIGYPQFISEIREEVDKGWRTWQIISDEMLFTQVEKE